MFLRKNITNYKHMFLIKNIKNYKHVFLIKNITNYKHVFPRNNDENHKHARRIIGLLLSIYTIKYILRKHGNYDEYVLPYITDKHMWNYI